MASAETTCLTSTRSFVNPRTLSTRTDIADAQTHVVIQLELCTGNQLKREKNLDSMYPSGTRQVLRLEKPFLGHAFVVGATGCDGTVAILK